jgi:metal-sulfur cluster biosynthetic enzyme
MSRKKIAIQRRLVSLIQKWNDPHGISLLDLMQSMDINDDSFVQIYIQPSRPHCACCLFDLESLRDNINKIKGVNGVQIIVSGIPEAERWTRALSSS